MNPVSSILITLMLLGIIIAFAGWGLRVGKLSNEMARKAVHVGMGLICLSFPWIFDSVLAVQVLAVLAMLTLFLVRFSKLRGTVGSALFSVERISIGELLFPLAVAWLFTLGWSKPLLYSISLLLLTLADTMGALAGSKYGKKIYRTVAATKSFEGSVAFFLTAYLCIAIPLSFFSELSLSSILFLSFAIALFTTALEGASGHGLDNLLIPIGSFLLLDYYVGLDGYDVLIRSIVLLLLLVLLLSTRHKHTFDGGATLTAMLFGFSAFTLGGIPCLLAALIVFLRHMFIQHRMPKEYVVMHSIEVIIFLAIPSLLWLTLGRGGVIEYQTAQFGFICTLSLILYMSHTGTQRHMNRKRPVFFLGFALSCLVLAPALLLDISLKYYLPVMIVGMPLSWFYFYWRGGTEVSPTVHWVKLSMLAFIFSVVVMMPIFI